MEDWTNITGIRYAQCWEDADILSDGLNIEPGAVCLSIASAGDNTLSLLTANPSRVMALDMNPAQLFCLNLKIAGFRTLEYGEMLELMGSRESYRRMKIYEKCRCAMDDSSREFWNKRPDLIENGIGSAGKFENYFSIFRKYILPLLHSQKIIKSLINPKTHDERKSFYFKIWDNWRWRILFRVFFSRFAMGILGREPSFFRYVKDNVPDKILKRVEYALTELDPSSNPYLHWILTGVHGDVLPHFLRRENFEKIRAGIHKLEIHRASLEEYLSGQPSDSIDRFNLSDVFEYMSPENYRRLLMEAVRTGKKGGVLAYWNMLVPRRRPPEMSGQLLPLEERASELFLRDRAFFYSAFVLEEIIK